MRQQTLGAQAGFEKYPRKSRRELVLEEMEQVVPWEAGGAGRVALSEGGERTAAGGPGNHAADLLCAAVVQPE